MNLNDENNQRKEFRAILTELAADQTVLQDNQQAESFYKRLEGLYYSPEKEKTYRHFYSDIFNVLIDIKTERTLGDVEVLAQNLNDLRNNYEPNTRADDKGNNIDISDSLRKLYDHVALDVARINYTDMRDQDLVKNDALLDLCNEIDQMEGRQSEVNNNFSELAEKLNRQQQEYVAILGIFAAVVISFTGGLIFSSSILNNIGTVSIYRLTLTVLLLALFLTNILYGLYYYIDKLVSSREKSATPIIIVNGVIIALISGVVLLWYFGAVEARNLRILIPPGA